MSQQPCNIAVNLSPQLEEQPEGCWHRGQQPGIRTPSRATSLSP